MARRNVITETERLPSFKLIPGFNLHEGSKIRMELSVDFARMESTLRLIP